jgi:hypothetical protein
MKRLTWLLLAFFCTTLVQVLPADGLVKAKLCPCCHPGACGMPGCCPPPASASTVFTSTQSVRVSSSPVRKTQLVRSAAAKFYALFVEATAVRGPLLASAQAAPAANVPLFKAHCSLLI